MRFTVQCIILALAINAVAAAPLPEPAKLESTAKLESNVANGSASPYIGVTPVAVLIAKREALPIDAEAAEEVAKGGEGFASKLWKGAKKNKWNIGLTAASFLPSLLGGSNSNQQPSASS